MVVVVVGVHIDLHRIFSHLERVVVVVGVHKDLHLQNIQSNEYDVLERGRGGCVVRRIRMGWKNQASGSGRGLRAAE